MKIMLKNKETGEIFNQASNCEGYYLDLFTQKVYEACHDYYDGLSLTECKHLEVLFSETMEGFVKDFVTPP